MLFRSTIAKKGASKKTKKRKRVTPLKIVIHHNDEIGEMLWSVCDENHFENWIGSFKSLEESIKFIEHFEHDTYKVICSISECKEHHSLTDDVPDTSCGLSQR